MRNTTIHLPELYFKLIDEIICEKDYPCVSEFVRIAIRKLLKRDTALLTNPKIGGSSAEMQNFVIKQKKALCQKNLDQFKVILDQNPALQQRRGQQGIPIAEKQTRMERFWK